MPNFDRFSERMPWEDKEPEVAYRCVICGQPICYGDEYVEIEYEKICMDCIDSHTHTAR